MLEAVDELSPLRLRVLAVQKVQSEVKRHPAELALTRLMQVAHEGRLANGVECVAVDVLGDVVGQSDALASRLLARAIRLQRRANNPRLRERRDAMCTIEPADAKR